MKYLLIRYICLQSFFIAICYAITRSHINRVAEQISQRLNFIFQQSTKYDVLLNEYELFERDKVFQEETIVPQDISSIFNQRLQDELFKKTESLRRIKRQGEHLYNSHHSVENVSACKNQIVQENYNVSEHVQFFPGLKVSINQSLAQVPQNIYRCDKAIVNAEQWSLGLDDAFLQNFKNSPDLLWQYFGSVTGLFRSFPGADESTIDLTYDPRRRLWYSQAINSAKDVVIAVDLTGSIVGTPFKIVKLVTKSLIETFQQNDFFNVIYLRDNEASIVDVCEDKLMQATNSNKDVVKNYIDELPSPHGEGELDILMTSALRLLNASFHEEYTSSMCNKILMIVSDGLEFDSKMEELLDSYKHLNVVIFYYFIGYGNSNDKFGGECAFFNRKQLYKFPTLGSVPIGVLEYQSVLNTPFLNATSQDNVVEFTPLYKDFFKLGLMVTIAAGLYGNNGGERKLLGVAGIDVKITILEQMYPKSFLGVFGHGFVINNNGLVLIHPKLDDVAKNYQDPSTVFLEDVEHSDHVEEVKRLMINREETCIKSRVNHHFPNDLKRRYYGVNTTYCVKPINGTPYSSSVSIPTSFQLRFVSSNVNYSIIEEGLSVLSYKDQLRVEIANWRFCNFTSKHQQHQPASILVYPTAQEVYEFLSENSLNMSHCDEKLLYNLLASAAVLNRYVRSLQNHAPVYLLSVHGIVLLHNTTKIKFDRDILQSELLLQPLTNKKDNLVITVPLVDSYNRPLRYQSTDKNLVYRLGKTVFHGNIFLGVNGVELSETTFSSIIQNATDNTSCSECKSFFCENIDNYLCILVDENGYVVYSNQGNGYQVGYFLGLVNGKLLDTLVELQLYDVYEYTETKHKCESVSPSSQSNAHSIFSSYFLSIFLNYVKLFLLQLLTFDSERVSGEQFINNTRYEFKCSKRFKILKRNDNMKNDVTDYIKCSSSCQNKFSVARVGKTNLDFIVLENNCNIICMNALSSNEPIREEDRNCSSAKKYRRPRDSCFQKLSQSFGSQSVKINISKIFTWGIVFFQIIFYKFTC